MTDEQTGGQDRETESHRFWEDLAAGHALNGLDRDEQALFVRHAAGCAECTSLVTAYRSTLTGLDELIDPDLRREPDAALVYSTADPRPVRAGRRRLLVVLALTASLFSVLGVGIGALVARPSPPSTAPAELLADDRALLTCLRDAACQSVPMVTPANGVPVVALLTEDAVWLVLEGLEANDIQRSNYVVWQLPSEGAPIPLTSFDVATARVLRAGNPPLPLTGTSGFMISLEPRGAALQAPTQQVAIGEVPAPPGS